MALASRRGPSTAGQPQLSHCGGKGSGAQRADRGRQPRGNAVMPRRERMDAYDYSLTALTWLFAWLFVIAAVAGLFSEVMH